MGQSPVAIPLASPSLTRRGAELLTTLSRLLDSVVVAAIIGMPLAAVAAEPIVAITPSGVAVACSLPSGEIKSGPACVSEDARIVRPVAIPPAPMTIVTVGTGFQFEITHAPVRIVPESRNGDGGVPRVPLPSTLDSPSILSKRVNGGGNPTPNEAAFKADILRRYGLPGGEFRQIIWVDLDGDGKYQAIFDYENLNAAVDESANNPQRDVKGIRIAAVGTFDKAGHLSVIPFLREDYLNPDSAQSEHSTRIIGLTTLDGARASIDFITATYRFWGTTYEIWRLSGGKVVHLGAVETLPGG